jgi:putative transposase
MNREGIKMARCTVERLTGKLGLGGVRRGKRIRANRLNASAPCLLCRLHRQFELDRRNELWVSDFAYASTWQADCS